MERYLFFTIFFPGARCLVQCLSAMLYAPSPGTFSLSVNLFFGQLRRAIYATTQPSILDAYSLLITFIISLKNLFILEIWMRKMNKATSFDRQCQIAFVRAAHSTTQRRSEQLVNMRQYFGFASLVCRLCHSDRSHDAAQPMLWFFGWLHNCRIYYDYVGRPQYCLMVIAIQINYRTILCTPSACEIVKCSNDSDARPAECILPFDAA